MSLYEGLFRMEENFVAQLDVLGINKERTPMPSGASCPIGTFKTKDKKYVIIVCSTNPVFEHLCHAMDRLDWLPKYALAKDRLADPNSIMDALTKWVEDLDYAELKEKCDMAGVPISTIYSMKDIFADPQYAARNDIVEVPCEEFGTIKMPGVCPVLTETPGEIKWPGQKLGAQNEDVYRGILELSEEQIKELSEKKII